jgi:hypothetical protein
MNVDELSLELAKLIDATERAVYAAVRNRGTKTAIADKVKAVDRIFLGVVGRKATPEEHGAMNTDSVTLG